MKNLKKYLQIFFFALLAMMLVACSGSEETTTDGDDMAESGDDMADSGDGDVAEIKYVLWDINQFPAYEECAANFNAENDDINVTAVQVGWDDYWTSLQTDMVAGAAADVFTNHLAKYPEFASKNQILDISDCLLYTSPSPRDLSTSRMPSSA